MIVEEGWALLGGIPEFIELLQKFIPNLDEQVYAFLKSLQDLKADGIKLELDWLPCFLFHVYGVEMGGQLLQEVEAV